MTQKLIKVLNDTFDVYNKLAVTILLLNLLITLNTNYFEFVIISIYMLTIFFNHNGYIKKIYLKQNNLLIIKTFINLFFYLFFHVFVDNLNKKHKIFYEIIMSYLNFFSLFIIAYIYSHD